MCATAACRERIVGERDAARLGQRSSLPALAGGSPFRVRPPLFCSIVLQREPNGPARPCQYRATVAALNLKGLFVILSPAGLCVAAESEVPLWPSCIRSTPGPVAGSGAAIMSLASEMGEFTSWSAT